MTTKTCGTCGQAKPLEDFHKATLSPLGRNKHCKVCFNTMMRVRRAMGLKKVRRNSIPNGRGRPLAERLWAKVDKNGPTVRPDLGPCWLWTGVHNGTGYGQIYTGVWREGEQRMILVHRAALIVSGVKLPRAMKVDHICKTILCCRPDHLRVVTPNVSTLENSDNFCARNKQKKVCIRGHDILSPGNYALIPHRGPRGRGESYGRICLTCRPNYWNAPKRIFITV